MSAEAAAAPAAKTLLCQVITPERVQFSQAVDFVALPLADGELGVLPGHVPVVGRLGYGELRTKVGGKDERFYIDGGFVQIRNNEVIVLTPRALPVATLDLQVIQKEYDLVASRPVSSPVEREAHDKAMERARSLRRIAGGSGGAAH